jgi:AhpD family alkylhydroperoxidase
MSANRIDPYTASPEAIKAMVALETYVKNCGLEHSLIDLVKTRASQINGCAYCLFMHTTDAQAAGEIEPGSIC